MSDFSTLKAEMNGQISLITQRLDAQEQQQRDNHTQNRKDIHAFWGWTQVVTDHLHSIDLQLVKLTLYVSLAGAAGGSIAAVISQYIVHLWKR